MLKIVDRVTHLRLNPSFGIYCGNTPANLCDNLLEVLQIEISYS